MLIQDLGRPYLPRGRKVKRSRERSQQSGRTWPHGRQQLESKNHQEVMGRGEDFWACVASAAAPSAQPCPQSNSLSRFCLSVPNFSAILLPVCPLIQGPSTVPHSLAEVELQSQAGTCTTVWVCRGKLRGQGKEPRAQASAWHVAQWNHV